jgi:membrane associated rhomboid family serine protease
LNPWVMRLLIANVACFGLQMILPPFTDWFRFYAPFAVVRPWTFVTYMFLHGDPMHILFNMLGLYIFGSRVESRMGGSRFLQMYLIAGVVGALAHAVLSPGAPVVGASAAVYGVLMAYAMFWPRDRIYVMGVFPIEAWLAIVLYGLYDLSSGIGGGGRVAHFAHLGGLAGAYIYIWAMDPVLAGQAVPGQGRERGAVHREVPQAELEERAARGRPPALARRGQPDPRQDQCRGHRQPHRGGETLPLQLRPPGRPEELDAVRRRARGARPTSP